MRRLLRLQPLARHYEPSFEFTYEDSEEQESSCAIAKCVLAAYWFGQEQAL